MSVQAIPHIARSSHSPNAAQALQSAYSWSSSTASDDDDQEVASGRTNTPAAVHALAEVMARLSEDDGSASSGQAADHLREVYEKLQARFGKPADGAGSSADSASGKAATGNTEVDAEPAPVADELAADQSPFERAVEPSRYSLAESVARMIEALGLPLWREPTEKGLAPGSLLHLDA